MIDNDCDIQVKEIQDKMYRKTKNLRKQLANKYNCNIEEATNILNREMDIYKIDYTKFFKNNYKVKCNDGILTVQRIYKLPKEMQTKTNI